MQMHVAACHPCTSKWIRQDQKEDIEQWRLVRLDLALFLHTLYISIYLFDCRRCTSLGLFLWKTKFLHTALVFNATRSLCMLCISYEATQSHTILCVQHCIHISCKIFAAQLKFDAINCTSMAESEQWQTGWSCFTARPPISNIILRFTQFAQ